MLALSVRQPFAELILRGIKTVEFRSRSTKIIGERFYLYACKGKSEILNPNSERSPNAQIRIFGENIAVPGEPPPGWLIELAGQVGMIEPDAQLPTGVIVGSAVIEHVTQSGDWFQWHLTDVERAKTPRKPDRHPQPVWFRPF